MTMSVGGLISGMDTSTLISQLIQAEAGPQTALKARLKSTQDTASAYRTVNTTFLAVSAAAEAALKPDTWSPIKATSSATSVAVSTTSGASSGSLTFTVKQLAASHAVMEKNATPGSWTSASSLYGAASITHDDEVSFAVADNRARQLAEVTRALEDYNAGRYGICRECGEAIAKARLKVMPFATRCVACQARYEGLDRAA